MTSSALPDLLRLPPEERAELAMALWESLSPGQREVELELTDDEAAEIERRWEEHERRPESAIPWETVRTRLNDEG